MYRARYPDGLSDFPDMKYPEPTVDEPTIEELSYFVFDSVCEATDGCEVEPDAMCEHGYPSWLLHLGMV